MHFVFQSTLGLTLRKETTKAKPNSPRAFGGEGLLSEGYLRLRFTGRMFWRGGGGYNQNFTVATFGLQFSL